jgi:hypothetical protein
VSTDRDPHISEIFYYMEGYTDTATGRTMGRKLGTIQEIICRKFLMQSQKLEDSVIFEPYLMGASGADHKVEFVFFQPRMAAEFSLKHTALGMFTTAKSRQHRVGGMIITLLKLNGDAASFQLERDGETFRFTLRPHEILRDRTTKNRKTGEVTEVIVLGDPDIALKVSRVEDDVVRLVVLNLRDVRASVESKRVGAQRFAGSEKLGSGIQTIEKAKQASLVAIDADLHFNHTIKALAAPGARRYISIVVLGNGVHWTEKDRAILRTYVDFTFLVPDVSVIRYLEYVKTKADAAGMGFKDYLMAYFTGMTKTPPDSFHVDDGDFEIIEPAAETRSLLEILEQHIDDYPVET